jgi:transcriptional regulator with XRE-family HTH domain
LLFGKANGLFFMANEPSASAPLEIIAASLRRERHQAGLSLTEVARRAGIAKSTLSQLESGTGNPSLETLWAICVALDAPFSRLLDPPRPSVQVIRADEGPTVASAEAE